MRQTPSAASHPPFGHRLEDSIETSPASRQTAILCLLNGAAHSDAAKSQRERLAEAFARQRQNVRIETPANGDILQSLAREAARAGAERIIAGGGDGTMNAVANALAGTETALAVLPMGTLNHFAKDLGIPLDLDAAMANACGGHARQVDVGEVNGRVFINNSSIGLYPQIVRKREALQRRGLRKWVALLEAAIAVFRRSRDFWVRLHAGARNLSGKTEFVFVGNNEYELTVPQLGSRTKLNGGALWIWYLPHVGRFRAIWLAVRTVFGFERRQSPTVLTAPELRIDMRTHKVEVAIDGEVMTTSPPLLYRCRPRALRVIVPNGEPAA